MKRKDKKSRSPPSSSMENTVQQNSVQSPVEVSDIVLWRKPILTSYYAIREIFCLLGDFWFYIIGLLTKKRLALFATITAIVYFLSLTPGSHQQVFLVLRKNVWWSLYWLGLGFLSSVGFGFGLHTFVLYLAPHVISVTLAAYECGSVDFLEPPYPDRMVCPDETGVVTPWVIMYKVIWECFMWGAGTAVGELPPYFMARTCRLSGQVDEEEAEIEELRRRRPSELALKDRCKIFIQDLVNKIGFFGILLCASVPNPLYDLAGVTCGHFLIPFWTFFGATLIGKSIIKMSIQTLFVIFVFSEHHFQTGITVIKSIPVVGNVVGPAFESFLEKQKYKLRHPGDKDGLLPVIFQLVVSGIVLCFLISGLNTLAQRHKRRQQQTTKDPETRK